MIVPQFTCRAIINSQLYAHVRKPWGIQGMARPSSGTFIFFLLTFMLHIQILLINKSYQEDHLHISLLSFYVVYLSSSVLFGPDLAAFREIFSKAKNIAIITGAGVSAESGVPTFRGAGGYWRKWQAQVGSYLLLLQAVEMNLMHCVWIITYSFIYSRIALLGLIFHFNYSTVCKCPTIQTQEEYLHAFNNFCTSLFT